MSVNLGGFFDQLVSLKGAMGPVIAEILFFVVAVILVYFAKADKFNPAMPISLVVGVALVYVVRFVAAPIIAGRFNMPEYLISAIAYFVPFLMVPIFFIVYVKRKLTGR